MNLPAQIPTDTLPVLLDRATSALVSARTSAEVLEARDFARVAYDAAKSAARMARAKRAHDSLIADVHRAQAHALAIRARAEMRLAEEYDAAQPDKATFYGNQWCVDDDNAPLTAASVGLRRDEIFEARRFRDAEEQAPGTIQRALDDMLDRGQEPTRAELRRSVLAAVDDAKRGPAKEKNPLFRKDVEGDRVSRFSSLCRSLAEFDDVEQIAAWSRIPQIAERLPAEVREAMRILSRFMEAQDA